MISLCKDYCIFIRHVNILDSLSGNGELIFLQSVINCGAADPQCESCPRDIVFVFFKGLLDCLPFGFREERSCSR